MSQQKGAAHLLLVLVLLAGLAFAVYLVQQKTNLFSKAAVSSPVVTADLTASCGSDNKATFRWPPMSPIGLAGKTVQNYTLRINAEPAETWAPRVIDRRDNTGGGQSSYILGEDLAIQVGNRESFDIVLSPGSYAGWDVTAGFVGETQEAFWSRRFGTAFICRQDGKPFITTFSLKGNFVEVRGINFGDHVGVGNRGTVYYKRDGRHDEIMISDGVYWTDSLLRVPKTINDPNSPTPNTIMGGQRIKVCRQQPDFSCSDYRRLPNF